ncbi:uncharacterized protein [Magallana gigas]|uniref:uncharacterized protein isoform X1 n=1 Tax=Magallana gigas TaxID=29159 RepID=UPI00333F957E
MLHLIIPMRDSGMMCCWNSTSNLVTNLRVQSTSQKKEGGCLQSRNPPTLLSGWLAPVSDIAPCTSMFRNKRNCPSKGSTKLPGDGVCSILSLTPPSLSTKGGTSVNKALIPVWVESALIM